jgi:putative membrane protein
MLRTFITSTMLASALPVVLSACLVAADEDMNPDHNANLNNTPPASTPAPHSDASVMVGHRQSTTLPFDQVLKKQDAEFVRCASSAGAFEIESSQWVLDHGLTGEPAVFARTMIADHTKIAQKLDALLTSKGLDGPDGMTGSDRKALDALEKTPENQLGKAYVDAQVAAHQTAVKLFADESDNGKDADLRAFAAANLDMLKSHLTHAQAVQ